MKINKNLTEQQDLLLMLIAKLKKIQRRRINALNSLADRVISAQTEQLEILEKDIRLLFA